MSDYGYNSSTRCLLIVCRERRHAKFLNNICVFAALGSGDGLMGNVPVGEHILLSSKHETDFTFRVHKL